MSLNIDGTTDSMTPSSVGLNLYGDISLKTAGNTINIKEGNNASLGIATLSGGNVTISNTKILINSRIFLTHQNLAGVIGHLYISNINPGVSFRINSTSVVDNSIVAWHIINPL